MYLSTAGLKNAFQYKNQSLQTAEQVGIFIIIASYLEHLRGNPHII